MAETSLRFQFLLRDLLGVVALTFVGICILSPTLLICFEPPRLAWPPGYQFPLENRVQACVLVTMTTWAGAVLGVVYAAAMDLKGWRRTACPFAFALLIWLFLLFYALHPAFRAPQI